MPSPTVVKVFLPVVAEKDLSLMLLDVECALLDRDIRNNVYFEELPRQDTRSGQGSVSGKAKNTMFGIDFVGHCRAGHDECSRSVVVFVHVYGL